MKSRTSNNVRESASLALHCKCAVDSASEIDRRQRRHRLSCVGILPSLLKVASQSVLEKTSHLACCCDSTVVHVCIRCSLFATVCTALCDSASRTAASIFCWASSSLQSNLCCRSFGFDFFR